MNIELKKWNEADFPVIGEIFTNCDRSYLSDGMPLPYTREHAQIWYDTHVQEREGKTGIYRIIFADGSPAGQISIECKEGSSYCCDAEMGYILLDEYKGKGVMTRAVAMACAEAFTALNILRISARVYSPNAASCRVLEKNGFVLEGRCPRSVIKGNAVYDMLHYGKLK